MKYGIARAGINDEGARLCGARWGSFRKHHGQSGIFGLDLRRMGIMSSKWRIETAAPNVEIVAVEPEVDGKLVYLEVAPAVAGGGGGAQVAITAGIQNNEPEPITLDQVTFNFISAVGGIQVAPIIFQSDEGFGQSTIAPGASKFIYIQKREGDELSTLDIDEYSLNPPKPGAEDHQRPLSSLVLAPGTEFDTCQRSPA